MIFCALSLAEHLLWVHFRGSIPGRDEALI